MPYMVTHTCTISFKPPLFDKLGCSFFKVVPCLSRLGVAYKEWDYMCQPWKESWKDGAKYRQILQPGTDQQ